MNIPMHNRRSEPRFPADQPVTVTAMDAAHEQSGAGTIVDYSASGIGLEVEFSLTTGCRVKIQWPRGQVLGEVRYCRQKAPGSFRAGVKITEVVELGVINEQSGAA
jgi:hypothetical protein